MKISCKRDKLLSAFQTASMVAPSRSPKQVLQNVKIIAAEDGVNLIATDMEVGIQLSVEDVEVEVPGSALLSVLQFGAILRESSDETMRVESDDNGVQVFGDRSKFKIPSSDPNTFPSIQSFDETSYHLVSARLIRELIKRTLFATDSESSRFALGGVLLEMESDSIIAVGTDGRRLAKMEGEATSVEGHSTGDTMTIVPSRAMQLIDRSLSDSEDELKLCVRGNDILVSSSMATINSRLVEGRFPRWRDVFPKERESIDIDLTVGPCIQRCVKLRSLLAVKVEGSISRSETERWSFPEQPPTWANLESNCRSRTKVKKLNCVWIIAMWAIF